jgi:hypothetical protein
MSPSRSLSLSLSLSLWCLPHCLLNSVDDPCEQKQSSCVSSDSTPVVLSVRVDALWTLSYVAAHSEKAATEVEQAASTLLLQCARTDDEVGLVALVMCV